MSEQQPPASTEDTAAVAGPEGTPGTAQGTDPSADPQIPFEKRYNDLRPQFDRVSQEAAELRNRNQWFELAVTSEDPDTQRQAYEALGYELPPEEEGEPEPVDYEDPYESLAERQARLEQRFEQQDQESRQAMENDFITGYSHDQLSQLGVGQDDEATRQWIFERALSLPHLRPTPGMPAGWLPDIKAAHEQFQAWETDRQKQWASTKRAPYVSPGGRPANEVPDPGTGHNARMNRAMQAVHEEQQG